MANQLALANLSGLSAASLQNGIDRNAVRIYEREKLIRYSVTLSGNYTVGVRGSNVGEVLNLAQALVPAAYQANQFWGYRGPVRGYVINTGGTGYSMSITPGADAFHWLLRIFSGVAAELAAGAYPAALTTDTDIVVEFSGNQYD